MHNLHDALLPQTPNVIYAFNFFEPRAYATGLNAELRYPGMIRCCDAHEHEHALCCEGNCCDSEVRLDSALLAQELDFALNFSRQNQVPVFVDQWGGSRNVKHGRDEYMKDLLTLLQARARAANAQPTPEPSAADALAIARARRRRVCTGLIGSGASATTAPFQWCTWIATGKGHGWTSTS